MTSPICTVKDGGGSAQATSSVATVTPSNTVTIALADATGVSTWSIACIYGDETTDPATINAGLTISSLAKTATFTAPAAGKAMIFQSQVNNGQNASLVTDATLTTTFKVATPAATGNFVMASNETYQHGPYGWLPILNTAARSGKSSVISNASTAYTIASSDNGNVIVTTSASAVTITLPNYLAAGTSVRLIQYGAGRVSFATQVGATLYNRQSYSKTAAQYAVVTLDVVSNSGGSNAVWVLGGDTAA